MAEISSYMADRCAKAASTPYLHHLAFCIVLTARLPSRSPWQLTSQSMDARSRSLPKQYSAVRSACCETELSTCYLLTDSKHGLCGCSDGQATTISTVPAAPDSSQSLENLMKWDESCPSGKRLASFHAAMSGTLSLGSKHCQVYWPCRVSVTNFLWQEWTKCNLCCATRRKYQAHGCLTAV